MTWFGFLNCYKPPGMTSRDLVNQVQRRLRKIKVGHAGTLDPIAEGVLVLGIGAAARLVTQVQAYSKSYTGEFRLGEDSPSQDTETEITRHPDLPVPDRLSIEDSAARMVGAVLQTPSAYSAIHVNGKRAYQRARDGEIFQMPSRKVQIYSVVVDHYDHPIMRLSIECGSGTYVRSIGSDLAKQSGSCAIMTSLRRSSVGPFHGQHAIDLQTIQHDDLSQHLLPASMAVEHLSRIVIPPSDVPKIYFGQFIDGELIGGENNQKIRLQNDKETDSSQPESTSQEVAAVGENGELFAILRRKSGRWHPYRVFPPAKEAVEMQR